jgi:hypothetical protein
MPDVAVTVIEAVALGGCIVSTTGVLLPPSPQPAIIVMDRTVSPSKARVRLRHEEMASKSVHVMPIDNHRDPRLENIPKGGDFRRLATEGAVIVRVVVPDRETEPGTEQVTLVNALGTVH